MSRYNLPDFSCTAQVELLDPFPHAVKWVDPCWGNFEYLSQLASFQGRRRNGLATSASSNCTWLLHHGNCNILLQQTSNSLVHVILANFSSCENGAFLLVEATVCCPLYYWSEIEVVRTKIVMQSTYTSAIEWLLLKWNGRDCDGSMHYAIGFTVVMWLRSEIWLVLPTFRQQK